MLGGGGLYEAADVGFLVGFLLSDNPAHFGEAVPDIVQIGESFEDGLQIIGVWLFGAGEVFVEHSGKELGGGGYIPCSVFGTQGLGGVVDLCDECGCQFAFSHGMN